MTRSSMEERASDLFLARSVLVDADTWLPNAGLVVSAGRVQAVPTASALRRARRAARRVFDLGAVSLVPGLVNAHAHLDLSACAGRVSAKEGFVPWIGALMRARAGLDATDLVEGARGAAAGMLATGTTLVGDIDSTGAALRASSGGLGARPRVRVFREVLDGDDPSRSAEARARVARALPRRVGRLEGISPHAPFSVSPGLTRSLVSIARRRGVPLSVHWSETREEVDWMLEGKGPFAELFARLGHAVPPRESGLERLEGAGALVPSTSLVHGNLATRAEVQRIASAGANLIHCPGSHAFFGRGDFDLGLWQRAGVTVALGTDSAASNDGLDMRRELALLRAAAPDLAPEAAWRMATENGARALALEQAGRLSPGSLADFIAVGTAVDGRRGLLEVLTRGAAELRGVWVAGRLRVPSPHRPLPGKGGWDRS